MNTKIVHAPYKGSNSSTPKIIGPKDVTMDVLRTLTLFTIVSLLEVGVLLISMNVTIVESCPT